MHEENALCRQSHGAGAAVLLILAGLLLTTAEVGGTATAAAAVQDVTAPNSEQGIFDVGRVDLVTLNDQARGREIELMAYYPTYKPAARYSAEAAPPYPLIIFSHGAGGNRRVAPELLAYWASHGFVVLAPTHADSIALRRAAGEDADINNTLGGFAGPEGYRNSRTADVHFILDNLDELAAMAPELDGLIDNSRIGIGGHSAGAMTAAMLAGTQLSSRLADENTGAADPRIYAALLLSAQGMPTYGLGMFDEDSWAELTLPLMVMTGSLDDAPRTRQSPQTRRHPYDYAPPGDKYLLFIEGAAHMSFTGKAAGAEGPGKGKLLNSALGADGELMAQIDDNDQQAIFDCIKASSLAFWLSYLNDDAAAAEYLTSGGPAEFPGADVDYETK